ncbi:MAG: Fic family protein [Gammaproteobacteria bacterium]|nr:Fic family protein [Gammaproteobacteria bacterium]
MKSTLEIKSLGISYHYGKFPPSGLDYARLVGPIAEAAAMIARYEQMLTGIHNTRLFLTPLEHREVISSSRMEGTVSTLDELLMYEANIEQDESGASARQDTLEVHAYRATMNHAEREMDKGAALSPELLCACHQSLLGFTRGRGKSPGQFKTKQNYLVDMASKDILFTPISPDYLQGGLEKLFLFMDESEEHPLIRTAIAHVEFEALHPFNDGNGRIGRILITLMMWKLGLISRPHFYISGYLEQRKSDYAESMRAVSVDGDWTSWCIFFLEAIRGQAEMNLIKSEEMQDLYESMKETFRIHLSSQWSINALDFIFANPVFRNSTFIDHSGVPKSTARRFTRMLLEAELLTTLRPPSGRRPGLYAFEPLLQIVRP